MSHLRPDFFQSYSNLVEVLELNARINPAKKAFIFLIDGQSKEEHITFAELDQRAKAIAVQLRTKAVPKERAVLIYPPGIDYIAAFMGCLYANVIAVPVYPPDLFRLKRTVPRLRAIVKDAQANLMLTTSMILPILEIMHDIAPEFREKHWLATDTASLQSTEEWHPPEMNHETIAFLQYTSGSTGNPKGVMVTHGNLLAHLLIIRQASQHDDNHCVVGWLPLYHDMGLIGTVIQPACVGFTGVLMSPLDFLKRPLSWLEAISRFRAESSPAPNFAYDLCVSKIIPEERKSLDLSCWKFALSGAEPIRPATIERFCEAFAACGFKREAFYPSYGLAESTLMVTGGNRAAPPVIRDFDAQSLEQGRIQSVQPNRRFQRMVGCGYPRPNLKVVIANPLTKKRCAAGKAGEIWVSGPTVAKGYWNNKSATEEAFNAFLEDNGEGPFLRTGDLGFIQDQEVFIASRLKDLIVLRGANYFPQDIEEVVVSSYPTLKPGCCAVFSIEVKHEERLAVAVEVERRYLARRKQPRPQSSDRRKGPRRMRYDHPERRLPFNPEEVYLAIRKTVLAELDIDPYTILLVKIGQIPKTSSGKIRRSACRNEYLKGTIDLVGTWINPELQKQSSEKPVHSGVVCQIPALEEHPEPASTTPLKSALEKDLVSKNALHAFRPVDSHAGASTALTEKPDVTKDSLLEWAMNWISFRIDRSLSERDLHLSLLELGLDSIAGMELIGALGRKTGRSLSFNFSLQGISLDSLVQLILSGDAEAPVIANLVKHQQRIQEAADKTDSEPRRLPCLSPGQRQMWLLTKGAPRSPLYNLSFGIKITGPVDETVLQSCVDQMVRRHDALRTTIQEDDGIPMAIVQPPTPIQWRGFDLRSMSSSERELELSQLTTAEAKKPFDISQSPLVRSQFIRLSKDESLLVLHQHHIASDGWSFGVWAHELAQLYRSYRHDATAELPPPALQFSHISEWYERWLKSQEAEELREYWRGKLSGLSPLALMPDHRPEKGRTFQGASVALDLGPELTRCLKDFASRERKTPFQVLLTSFAALLNRYTSQQEFAIGTVVANRGRVETHSLIGYLANTLVLRCDLSGHPTFYELLSRVHSTCLEAFNRQALPFEEVVRALKCHQPGELNPLLRACLVLENTSVIGEQIDDTSWQPWLFSPDGSVEGTTKFDLSLVLGLKQASLQGHLEYSTDLFDQATMQMMARCLITLLTEALRSPGKRISSLPLLNDKDRHQVLVEWNKTEAEFPDVLCVHQLFEQQVEKNPEGIAAVFEEQELTYHDLNSRANQLAHYLQRLGVDKEKLVGICMERSLEMVVGLLGILKAGGVYLPLDPTYPQKRLSYMISDAQLDIALTQKRLASHFADHQIKVIYIDADWPAVSVENQQNAVSHVSPNNLAYVLYTSGSTGQPKGVCCYHLSVMNLLADFNHRLPLAAGDRCSFWTSFGFDVSVYEIFSALLAGGAIHFVPEKDRGDVFSLFEWLSKSKIHSAYLPPFFLHSFDDWLFKHPDQVCLKRLLVGVEPIPFTLLTSINDRLPGLQIFNGYGPTESTVCSTLYPIKPRAALKKNTPIGRPLQNTSIFLLDDNLEPLPIGVPGELYIGGVGLARGYLNQPQLTREKFIPHPFSTDPSARLYKTGDLARYLPDGNIEFLGRIDHQVKVRGFRIELGEIESALVQHPNVREAIALAREDQPGNKQLVAYITSKTSKGKPPSVGELRSYLAQKLPDYMVPNAFVLLESLPLTPNGKVDRRALPPPERSGLASETEYIAPRTPTEEILADIWREVLGLERVGVHDNFFELGGHSLLAVRLIASIQKRFSKALSLASVFQGATIAKQAALLCTEIESETFSPLVTIQPSGNLPPFFCVHPIGGNVLCYTDLAQHLAPDQPFYGLQSIGLYGERNPLTQINDMARNYIEVLRTVQPHPPYILGGWSFGGVVAFEMAQQLCSLGQEVPLVVMIDSYAYSLLQMDIEDEEAALLNLLVKDVGGMYGKELSISIAHLQHLSHEEKFDYVLKQIQTANLFTMEVIPKQLGHLLNIYKANVQALCSYIPLPYRGKVALFRTTQQALAKEISAPKTDWKHIISDGLYTFEMPCDHYEIIRTPHVQQVAGFIRSLEHLSV